MMRLAIGVLLACGAGALLAYGEPGRADLVPNSSFESDGGWETQAAASAEKSRTGSRGLKLATLSEPLVEHNWTRVQALSDRFPIKPSTWYTMSVWVLVPETFRTARKGGGMRGAHASLPIFDAQGDPLGPSWTIGIGRELNRAVTTDGTWVHLRRHFRTPRDAAFARVRLGVADVGAAFFDDVSLVEMDPGERRSPCTITSPQPSDSSRPAFRNGRWRFKGEPFFPFGFWGSSTRMTIEDVGNVRRHHANLIGFLMDWTRQIEEQAGLERIVAEAERQGVYVVLLADTLDRDLRNVSWTEAQAKAAASFAGRYDNIIGWMLRDDAPCRTEVIDVVHQNATLLRRFEPSLPFMVDLVPRRGSLSAAWGEWSGFLDMMCTYVYPIPYVRTLHFNDELEAVQQLVDYVQETVQPPMLWYVVQAHIQDHYRKLLGIPGNDQFLASPEQVRLVTYYVIQRGVRGIYFFRYCIETPACQGEDRMAEIGIMGCELEVVGRFFAGGERLAPIPVRLAGADGEHVEAVPFRYKEETLYLLTRHGREFQVHVDAEPCRVRVSLPSSCQAAWRLHWPTPEPLSLEHEDEGVAVELPDFDLIELLLTSSSPESLATYRSSFVRLLPDVACFATEGAEATADKFEGVFKQISAAMPAEIRAAVSGARDRVQQARTTLDGGKCAEAYAQARAAQRGYRGLISRCVGHARGSAKRDKQFIAYRRLLDLLVGAHCLEPGDARKLGHWASYTIPESMVGAFDADEPLATVFYTLPRFYGAFTSKDLLKELVAGAEKGLGSRLEKTKSVATTVNETLDSLKRGDFVSAAEKLEVLVQ